MPEDRYENFPRQKLPVQVNRRQFMRDLLNELRAARAGRTDHPALKLRDLGEMPDAELSWIVPVQIPGCVIATREDYISGRPAFSPSEIRLFSLDSPAAWVLRMFDGNRTIADTARSMAEYMDWDKNRAFDYVRGIFLQLVLNKIMMPKSM